MQKQNPCGTRRICFISASYLVREYQQIPKDVLDNAIFFFGSKRSWVFPMDANERRESTMQPTAYLSFPPDFKDLILEKEKQGLLFWLKPEQDYNKVSHFIQTIKDPTTNKNYQPLILDDSWWENVDKQELKYMKDGKRVISNYQTGEHDYNSTMELLYQSNKTLVPCLSFQRCT